MTRKLISLLVFLLVFLPSLSLARVGVSISNGKIELNDKLKPGGIYNLPLFVVSNNGDEPSEYEVRVAYHEDIPQKKPAKEWFSFEPRNFHLEPTQSQQVKVVLSAPIKTEPGDYFAYIEAAPVKTATMEGGAVIGVAAAAKLYFTVAPANLWQGIYYRAISLWKHYSPWTYVISAILVLSALVVLLRRFFSFDIGIGRKKKKNVRNFENPRPYPPESAEDSAAGDKDYWMKMAFQRVEEYYKSLSPQELDRIFHEARSRKSEIIDYFLFGDERIFHMSQPPLQKILKLSRKGLEQVRAENPKIYKELEKMVIQAITD